MVYVGQSLNPENETVTSVLRDEECFNKIQKVDKPLESLKLKYNKKSP